MVFLKKTCREQTSIAISNSEHKQYTWKLSHSGQIKKLKKSMVQGHLGLQLRDLEVESRYFGAF